MTALNRLSEPHFQELHKRFFRKLSCYASFKMENDLDDPDSIVNEAFFNTWKSALKGKLSKRVKTDLHFYNVMRLKVRQVIGERLKTANRQKRGGGRLQKQSINEMMDTIPDHSSEPVGSQQFRALVSRLRRRLNGLNDQRYGDIFTLRLENATHFEISQRIGIAEPTVRDRLKRARNWMVDHTDELLELVPS
ncbi:MAG: hypothetical protein CME32_08740 [Gimesia sp.]|nr:hypothetical protein [Gimesia sp.]